MKKRSKRERSEIARIKVQGASAAEEKATVMPHTASDSIGLRGECLVVLFLAVAVLIPYGQVLGFGFVDYDDNLYITENTRVAAGLTMENVVWAFTTGEGSNWHPLTWLSYLLDVQIFGATNAAGFHLVNVLFHALNSALLFLLLHRMTRALWPSVFVAALFAVHPLHVESVAWIAERKDVLSTFFWLLTMMAYLRYVALPGFRYLLVVVFFVLGLMSKPMLVTLPAVLLLMDYWPLRRMEGDRPNGRWPWLLIEKLPLFALAVASSVVTVLVQVRAVASLESFPLWLRAANAVVAYGKYIVMTVMPIHLAAFYPHPGPNIAFGQVVAAGAFLAGVSVVVVLWRKSRPYLLVGWLWYLGTLVPVIGLVQVGTQALADRYTYIPLTGLFIMLFYGAADLVQSGRLPKRIFVSAGTVWVVVLILCSAFQAHLWRDTFSLFNHALQVTPPNFMAHNALGLVLMDQRKLDEAKDHFVKAVEINPACVEAHNNLGLVLVDQEHLDEAKVHFLKALEIEPDYAGAQSNLGLALRKQGNLDEAQVHFLKALELKPDFAKAHQGLGAVLMGQGHLDEAKARFLKSLELQPDSADTYYGLGVVLAKQGHFEEAKAHFLKAIELQPDLFGAHNYLGMILLDQGNLDEAKAHFLKALESQPNSVEAHNNLGMVLVNQGVPDEAKVHFLRAIELQPDSAKAYHGLGAVLVNQGSIEEAKVNFLKAIELQPDYAEAYQGLGAALANQGRLDEAKAYFLKAIELDPAFVNAHVKLGVILKHQGLLDEAKAHFLKALEIKPDSSAARKNLDEMR